MTLAEQLARWATAVEPDTIPGHVRHAAARHLLDGLGTALAARRTGAVEPAVAVALGLGGPAEATLFGSTNRISAPAAAFANGALVHALDFDDTHAGGLIHATAVVLPAAFAIGEQVGASGADVLTAAVAGYEIACRVAMAAPHGFHARGLHATQVAGVFSAAAVTARLHGLDAEAVTNALGIAGSSAGGLLEFLSTGAATKQLHPGSACLNGILAARLAAAGATGPATVLEGPRGVYAALSARPADPESVIAGLGETWELARVTVKPYPACQLLHAALDATRDALAAGPVAPETIERVEVEVHPDSAAVVCEPAAVKARPRTPYDAKFSLAWSVAALVHDGSVDIDTYSAASIARPQVAELAARVCPILVASPGAAADAPSRVTIETTDGTVRSGAVPVSSGGPDRPISDAALRAKFRTNCGSAHAEELADRMLALSREPDLTGLLHLAARTVKERA